MIKYEITKPCTENWDKMKQVPGGRFCDKCAKKVHDLTDGKNPPAVGESFCGRMLVAKTRSIPFGKFLWRQSPIRYLALMFLLLIGNKIKAQLNKINANGFLVEKDTEFENDQVITVSGQLTNGQTGQDVADAFISIYDSQRNLLKVERTDSCGNFSFLVLKKKLSDSLFSVKAEYIGMESVEITNIPVTKKCMKLKLIQEETVTYIGIMGGAISYSYYTYPNVIGGGRASEEAYRHLPNKDIREVSAILANSPVMGR